MSADGPDRPDARRPADVWSAIAAAILGLVVLVALLAPVLAVHEPLDQDLTAINRGPTQDHLLGTDNLGRDVWARLLHGARVTLTVGALGAGLAFALGAGLGLLALVFGRWTELAFFAAVDLIRALPATLLAVLLIVGLGSGVTPVIVALALSYAPLVAYVARTAYHGEIARDYVRAARSFGGTRLHLLGHHILPNMTGTLVTQAAIILPRCIVTESVMSFLGLGASPDEPTWGRMIADASRFIEKAPHAILAPIAALVVLTVALSLLGDRVRSWLDPARDGGAPRRDRVDAARPAAA